MSSLKVQFVNMGCVHFFVNWAFWYFYDIYIAPKPALESQKSGNIAFNNMGRLNAAGGMADSATTSEDK